MEPKMNPELTRQDTSAELWREYVFPDGSVYRIDGPKELYMRPGGSTHRVVDASGTVHCIAFPGPGGSVVIRWKQRDGSGPVSF